MSNSEMENNFHTLKILNIVLSSLCYFGYFFVFFIYWFFKEIRSFSFDLVIWLCLSSCFYNVGWLLWSETEYKEHGDYSATCIAQSVILTVFENSTLIITCLIGYTAYINMLNSKHIERHKGRYLTIFLSITFIVPLILGAM